jgi:sec-independent protein translocase protein TatB
VRQSDLDEVKKQLTASSGLDLQSLDPTKEIRSHIQEGMAEGEKAIAEGKSMFDNPLAEPESAPQIAAETLVETPPETPVETSAETAPAAPETPSVVTAEAAPVSVPGPVPVPPEEPVQEKPAKAAAE